MRIENKIQIVGALTRPGDRSAGNWSRSGSGTCVWSWDISWSQRLCASPRSLLPSRRKVSRLLLIQPHLLLPLGMAHPLLPPPGKPVASQGKSFLSSPMGRCGVQRGSRFVPMSGVEKLTGACAWSMREATAVAAPGLMPRAVSMEWECYGEAAPSQCAVPSPDDRFRTHPMV